MGAVLTERETQVVALVCEGHPNKEIGRQMDLSEGTVKQYLHAVYHKLGIQPRVGLISASRSAGPRRRPSSDRPARPVAYRR